MTTNYEKIKNMTIEEMAQKLFDLSTMNSIEILSKQAREYLLDGWRKFLESEAL